MNFPWYQGHYFQPTVWCIKRKTSIVAEEIRKLCSVGNESHDDPVTDATRKIEFDGIAMVNSINIKKSKLTLPAPGFFVWSYPRKGAQCASPTCLKPDRKLLLTWNLAQSYFVMLQKKMIESFLQNCSYSDDNSLIMSIFLKIMWKMAKIWFFLKLIF